MFSNTRLPYGYGAQHDMEKATLAFWSGMPTWLGMMIAICGNLGFIGFVLHELGVLSKLKQIIHLI